MMTLAPIPPTVACLLPHAAMTEMVGLPRCLPHTTTHQGARSFQLEQTNRYHHRQWDEMVQHDDHLKWVRDFDKDSVSVQERCRRTPLPESTSVLVPVRI